MSMLDNEIALDGRCVFNYNSACYTNPYDRPLFQLLGKLDLTWRYARLSAQNGGARFRIKPPNGVKTWAPSALEYLEIRRMITNQVPYDATDTTGAPVLELSGRYVMGHDMELRSCHIEPANDSMMLFLWEKLQACGIRDITTKRSGIALSPFVCILHALHEVEYQDRKGPADLLGALEPAELYSLVKPRFMSPGTYSGHTAMTRKLARLAPRDVVTV